MPLDQVQDDHLLGEEGKNMSFLDHVEELRWHIVRSLIAVMVFAIAAFIFKGILFDVIIFGPKNLDFWTYRQLCDLSYSIYGDDTMCIKEMGFTVQNISMSGQFTQHMMVAFVAGIILAFPYLLWEIWRFVKPALHEKEIKKTRGFVFFASILFLLGVAFGYFILSPVSVNFLGSYRVSDQVASEINLGSYISFVTTLTFGTGLMFELPVLIYFLAKMGLVSSELLKKYRRYALVIILILAAIVTPPDVTSQILISIPIFALYELGIVIAKNVEKKRGY